jgi:hypothetical protein
MRRLPVAVEVELSVKGSRKARGDLPGVGALPDLLGGPLLRAAARSACRFPRCSPVHPHDAIRILSLEEAFKDVLDVRFAA